MLNVFKSFHADTKCRFQLDMDLLRINHDKCLLVNKLETGGVHASIRSTIHSCICKGKDTSLLASCSLLHCGDRSDSNNMHIHSANVTKQRLFRMAQNTPLRVKAIDQGWYLCIFARDDCQCRSWYICTYLIFVRTN